MFQSQDSRCSLSYYPYPAIAPIDFNNLNQNQPFERPLERLAHELVFDHNFDSNRTYFEDLNSERNNINNVRNNNINNNENLCTYHMTTSELEAEAALTSGFLGLQGPLVGHKKSSHAITEEYAKADPVYVQKTAVLPQTYSHYRPILGDGNCGWRAVGFAYFETLLRLQSKARLEEELARMSSLNNLLTTAGRFEQWLFEDMVLETTSLMKDLAEQVEINPKKAESILMERFNNSSASNAIVYHFRLLASSWLKANPLMYEGFIIDGSGVDAYSKNYIEPVNVEIEHLIMCLLIDVLLKPIGIAVEIVYLDRTPGPHANTHIFQQEDPVGVPTNPGGPVIHLLFRPSHYDILYKDQSTSMSLPVAILPQSTNLQANRAFTEQHVMQSTPAGDEGFFFDTSLLFCLPDFSKPLIDPNHEILPQQLFVETPEQVCLQSVGNSSKISPCTSPTCSVSSSNISSHMTIGTQLESPTFNSSSTFNSPTVFNSPTAFNSPSTFPHYSPSEISSPHRSSFFPLPTRLPSRSSTTSFRPSKYEWAAASDWHESHVALQSPTFKNSHYNTAHYNNVNFQPEQWVPELDDAPVSRKKHSSS